MDERDLAISAAIGSSVANADPVWVMYYEIIALDFLRKTKVFHGSKLCEYARLRGLWEPDTHNRWVGMPTVLHSNGWIEPVGYTEPKDTPHAHIGSVRVWRSRLYDPSYESPFTIARAPCPS